MFIPYFLTPYFIFTEGSGCSCGSAFRTLFALLWSIMINHFQSLPINLSDCWRKAILAWFACVFRTRQLLASINFEQTSPYVCFTPPLYVRPGGGRWNTKVRKCDLTFPTISGARRLRIVSAVDEASRNANIVVTRHVTTSRDQVEGYWRRSVLATPTPVLLRHVVCASRRGFDECLTDTQSHWLHLSRKNCGQRESTAGAVLRLKFKS